MDEERLKAMVGKHVVYGADVVEITGASQELGNFTYLGHRYKIYLEFQLNGEKKRVMFIEGVDEIVPVEKDGLEPKVHVYMNVLSRSESCYLYGVWYEDITFRVDGDEAVIDATPVGEDGNFNMRDRYDSKSFRVPLSVINDTKEEMLAHVKGKRGR